MTGRPFYAAAAPATIAGTEPALLPSTACAEDYGWVDLSPQHDAGSAESMKDKYIDGYWWGTYKDAEGECPLGDDGAIDRKRPAGAEGQPPCGVEYLRPSEATVTWEVSWRPARTTPAHRPPFPRGRSARPRRSP
ncbi:hypothetical protein [Streptomyces synnematoformans]|uniref:Uncharacterized protein n=1 Tax=Streptomyces synnematoformans TaxID=415721 RepID=A0ABN2Y6Y2_9ACTN